MRPIALFRAALAAIAILASGCGGMGFDTAASEAAVASFHRDLDAGRFQAIYVGTGEAMKEIIKQDEFVTFLAAIHRKLGDSGASTQQNWNVNFGPQGKTVTIVYKTTYERGEADEQFVFKDEDGRMVLIGYHINSNALIIN